MSGLRVTVIPVGHIDATDVEAALSRVAKVIHKPVELREAAPVPRGTEDTSRRQHRAPALLAALRASVAPLRVQKLVGADAAGSPIPTPSPDATIFVTDLDLFAPDTEGVFEFTAPSQRAAVISVRRLREAFYRRKADPKKQRARLVKEILRAVGRLKGLSDCPDPSCALAPTQVVPDLDRKAERYCGTCWRRLSSGVMRI